MCDNIEQEEESFVNDKRWKSKLIIFTNLSKPKDLSLKQINIDIESEDKRLTDNKNNTLTQRKNKDQLF